MVATSSFEVTWEKLPDDFVLPADPVDNIAQPPIAAALTESLELAGLLPASALTPTNYGICATVNGKVVVKAPDWAYVPQIRVARDEVKRSYTPQLQGEGLAIVMEFLSDTEGGEYSIKPTYPPGKWFFYERILQVPSYVIFEPDTGAIEVYRLNDTRQYAIQSPSAHRRYWLPEIRLFLGVWHGTRENRLGYWLRWWDEQGELLPWRLERIEQERQRAEQERQRAEQERQRADRLAAQLKAAGLDPEE